MSRTNLYEHTTTTAADALADAEVAVLPTGSVEQHGPALPLGTDLLVAREAALEDAEANGSDSWGKSVRNAPVGFDAIDFTESGAVGEPTEGSKEVGEELLAHASDGLDALVGWLAERNVTELWPRGHE